MPKQIYLGTGDNLIIISNGVKYLFRYEEDTVDPMGNFKFIDSHEKATREQR